MDNPDEKRPPSFWRDRADEARAKAANMVSEAGRQSMLEIARLYDGLANRSAIREARENEGPTPI